MDAGYGWVKYKDKIFLKYNTHNLLDRFGSQEINDFLDSYVVKYDDYNNEPTYRGSKYGMIEGYIKY